MKMLGVAVCISISSALLASAAAAEVITLRCNISWIFLGEQTMRGLILDTDRRLVRFDGTPYTFEGVADGEIIRDKIERFDEERIVFGSFWPRGRSIYTIDRITGSLTLEQLGRLSATGTCERTQAAF